MTHHRHGGHRHGGRGGIGFLPSVLVYELGCDPNDPYYRECMSRFGNDPRFSGVLDNMITENIDSIRLYFDQTRVQTPEAQKIKDVFVAWYDDLTWFGKGLQSNYDLARNQRNRFNLANVTTPEEKTIVETVIKTGLSTEQVMGQPDRRDETGMLPGPVKPPPPPLIPKQYLIGGAIVASLALIASAYGYGKG